MAGEGRGLSEAEQQAGAKERGCGVQRHQAGVSETDEQGLVHRPGELRGRWKVATLTSNRESEE